jgi:hypothetical protein
LRRQQLDRRDTKRLPCRRAIAALCVVAVSLSGAAPAQATTSGTNGRIVFTSGRDLNYEVYSMNADGSAPLNLSANPAADMFPAVSAGGGRIAFTSFRNGGNAEIYVMNADGSGQTRLTYDAGLDSQPTWSPDGQQIAFRTDRDGDWEIYVMNADGSGQVNLTNSPGTDDAPAWSPDGGRIAFETDRDGNREVYVMNADGSGPVDLTTNPAQDQGPSWAPDGQRIAFHSDRDGNDEIYTMSPSGSLQTRLTTDPGSDSEPAWSADQSKLLFRSNRDGNSEVYVMGADGGGQTRLTTTLQLDGHPDWQSLTPGYPRPVAAGTLITSLVPAYQQCTTGNRMHGPPLASPSCNPPVARTTYLTVGTSDANSALPNFVGRVRHVVDVGAPGPPDDSNDKITFSLTDVRCGTSISTCSGGTLSDYTGEVEVTVDMRLTDKNNAVAPGGGTESATVADTPLSFVAACAATAGAAGGSCPLTSSANVLFPGLIKDGKRMVFQLGRVRVFDGGADGQVATKSNTLFAVQGLFVP